MFFTQIRMANPPISAAAIANRQNDGQVNQDSVLGVLDVERVLLEACIVGLANCFWWE